MGRISYPAEVKWAVVKDKMVGELTTKEIMLKHGIKNKSQVTTWMRWFKNNELHRFDQPVGKQYSYGKGPNDTAKEDIVNRKMMHLQMENEILKKYTEIERGWSEK